jgi:spherulation-specific family 4 protein
MQLNKRRTIATAAMIAAALSMITTLAPVGRAFADDNNGLVVPMYGWDAGWSDVINAKHENKGTEIIVVINPASGPGGSKDSHWADVVDDLQDAGIKVVGYVATSYAGKSTGEVKDEIDRYYDWYDLDGIFFDEVSTSDHSYYKEIHDDAESPDGSQTTILNPGAPVPESYENAGDIIIAYENSGIPSHVESNGISESKLGALVHGQEPSEGEYKDLTDNVGYAYVAPDWMHAASTIEDQADWAD